MKFLLTNNMPVTQRVAYGEIVSSNDLHKDSGLYVVHHTRNMTLSFGAVQKYDIALKEYGEHPYIMKGVTEGMMTDGAKLIGKNAYTQLRAGNVYQSIPARLVEQDYDSKGRCIEERIYDVEDGHSGDTPQWLRTLTERTQYDHRNKIAMTYTRDENREGGMSIRFASVVQQQTPNIGAPSVLTDNIMTPMVLFGSYYKAIHMMKQDEGWRIQSVDSDRQDLESKRVETINSVDIDDMLKDDFTDSEPGMMKMAAFLRTAKETYAMMMPEKIDDPRPPIQPYFEDQKKTHTLYHPAWK